MSTSDVVSKALNPYTRNSVFGGTQSLLDQKMDSLGLASDDKQNRLDPAAAVEREVRKQQDSLARFRDTGSLASSGGGLIQNMVDLGQASVYREGENIANFATGNSNPNLQAEADSATGVSPALRQRLTDASTSSISSLADTRIGIRDGNYLDAAGSFVDAVGTTGKVLPELLADSLTGSIASGVAGTALTAGLGTVPTLLKKASRVADSVESTGNAILDAVAVKDAARRAALVKKSLTSAAAEKVGQVSLSTMAIMQQNEEAYIKENNKESSATHKAVNAPIALANMMFDRFIFMKALPSSSGAAVSAKAKQVYIDGVKQQIANVPKKYAKEVAKKVYSAGIKVAAVGGAESVQEYLQTWHSILQAKMDDVSIKSALKELRDEGNIDEANYSALVGAMVGGAGKAAVSVPGIAKEVGKGVAVNTGRIAGSGLNKVKDKVTDAGTRASLKVYSAEERQAQSELNKAETEKANVKLASRDDLISKVKEASTISDLKSNPDIAKKILRIQQDSNISDSQVEDSDLFDSIKDRLVSEYKGEKSKINLSLKSNSAIRVMKTVGGNVVDKSVAKAQETLNSVSSDSLVKSAAVYGAKGIEEIRNIKSSAARGVLDLAFREGSASAKTIITASKNLKIEDLKTIADALEAKNPELSASIKRNYVQKLQKLKAMGSLNSNLTSEENIPTNLKLVAEGSPITNRDSSVIFEDLSNVINGKIRDAKTLAVVETVLAKYKNTKQFKDGANKASVALLDDRLARQADRINNPIVKDALDSLGSLGKAISEKGLVPLISSNETVLKLSELVAENTPEEFKTKANELIEKLSSVDLPDMPDTSTAEGQDKLDEMIDNAYDSVSKKVKEAAKSVKKTVVGPEKETSEVVKKDEPDKKPDFDKVSKKLSDKLSKIENLLATGDEKTKDIFLKSVTDNIGTWVKLFKDKGYTTIDEVMADMASYPILGSSDAVIEALKKDFPSVKTEAFMSELTDKEPSTKLSEEESDNLFTILYPMCVKPN